MKKSFVFIGDSVTDCHRKRAERFQHTESALGSGFVRNLALGALKKHQVWNRGFAGSKTSDTFLSEHCWPEQLSTAYCTTLMIGINDIWHSLKRSQEVNFEASVMHFQRIINTIKLRSEFCIVMEPIALPFGEADESWIPSMTALFKEFERVCLENELVWLPLQRKLESEDQPEQYLTDGVHPSAAGHEWLAQQWLAQFELTTNIEVKPSH